MHVFGDGGIGGGGGVGVMIAASLLYLLQLKQIAEIISTNKSKKQLLLFINTIVK